MSIGWAGLTQCLCIGRWWFQRVPRLNSMVHRVGLHASGQVRPYLSVHHTPLKSAGIEDRANSYVGVPLEKVKALFLLGTRISDFGLEYLSGFATDCDRTSSIGFGRFTAFFQGITQPVWCYFGGDMITFRHGLFRRDTSFSLSHGDCHARGAAVIVVFSSISLLSPSSTTPPRVHQDGATLTLNGRLFFGVGVGSGSGLVLVRLRMLGRTARALVWFRCG